MNESTTLEEKADLRAGVNRAKDQIKDTADRWKRQARDSWDDLSDVIRDHPGKALGIALLAGLGLGAAVAASTRSRSRSYGPAYKLRDWAESGNDAWQTLRSGFNDAVCALKEAVDDAAGKFK